MPCAAAACRRDAGHKTTDSPQHPAAAQGILSCKNSHFFFFDNKMNKVCVVVCKLFCSKMIMRAGFCSARVPCGFGMCFEAYGSPKMCFCTKPSETVCLMIEYVAGYRDFGVLRRNGAADRGRYVRHVFGAAGLERHRGFLFSKGAATDWKRIGNVAYGGEG